VRFAARRRLPWADGREMLATFREFVSLAASSDSPLLEVRALATVTREEFGPGRRVRGREPVWILFQQRRPAATKDPSAAELLFRQADSAFGNHRPFTRWFRRAKLMEPVYDLYVAALPERGIFLENRFLAFIQALEAYDFRKTGVERKLREVVQSAVDDLPAGLRKHVPPTFADLVKDTRHYLTHYNPKYEKKAATGDRLFFASRAMKLLFELTMLLELGFPKRKVQALVEGNQRLVREFQIAFQNY
jgi:HEPN superfamily Apea-like protein